MNWVDGCNIAMKKNQKYVVQCIKGNNNRFGFGFRHKAGQYVTYDGKGTDDLNEASVYSNSLDHYCTLDDLPKEWEKYYQYVPIKFVIKRMDEMVVIP